MNKEALASKLVHDIACYVNSAIEAIQPKGGDFDPQVWDRKCLREVEARDELEATIKLTLSYLEVE